jgi:cell division protein FtsB
MSEEKQQSRENPREARRPRQLSSTQLMFAVILAIALMLAVQFSARIADERNLNAIRDTVEDEIELLQREQAQLIEDLAYVQSDAYVEEWARSEGRMVRDNMVLVIPIPSTVQTEATIAQPIEPNMENIETTLPEPENWQLWWALFFDSPAPMLGTGG